MPLDGHSYLVAQGWSGKGSGLRQGGITRPLAIPQKRTLAGLGKDRDEAFPFWDHLFSVAAKTIQVKIHKDNDGDSSNTDADTPSLPALTRTSTGLLSNKRPLTCTSISLGETSSSADAPRMSLLATAKRDAARKGLYARFFRGPVIGPDMDSDEKIASASTTVSEVLVPSIALAAVVQDREIELEERQKKERKDKRTDRKKEKSGRTNEEKEKKRDKKGKKREKERDEDGLCESGNVTTDERKRKRASSKDGKDQEKKKAKKRKREVEDVSLDAEGPGSSKGQMKERDQGDDKNPKSKKRRKEGQGEKKDEDGDGGSDNPETGPTDLKQKRKAKSSKTKSSSSENKARKGELEVKKKSGRKRERKDVDDASNGPE